MKDHQHHVINNFALTEFGYKVAYCGELIMGYSFVDLEHVFGEIQGQGRLLPCPKCSKKMIEILKTK